MSQPDSPLTRSIGLSGFIRWLIAVAAVIAIGAAFADGHDAMAIIGMVFLVVAMGLGYLARRDREAADEHVLAWRHRIPRRVRAVTADLGHILTWGVGLYFLHTGQPVVHAVGLVAQYRATF